MRTILLPLVVLTALASPAVHAATAYVIDTLEVTLRTGESTTHSIIRMLESGTRLDVLETSAGSGYSRVRTQAGTEGWVLTRFIDSEPIARDKLVQARRRLEVLDAQKQRLEGEIAAAKATLDELGAERDALATENTDLKNELAEIRRTSSQALQIAASNRELGDRVAEADGIVEGLRAENASLRDDTAQRWFIIGGGVVVFGMILGLILPRIRWRRKSSWGDL